eukprot:1140343-Pelagomonas_calceolata.AAC.2
MFDDPVHHNVPNDDVCWCARSNCKNLGEARDNGCMDNVKRLTWGSIGGVQVIKLISEVTGHALNLMLPLEALAVQVHGGFNYKDALNRIILPYLFPRSFPKRFRLTSSRLDAVLVTRTMPKPLLFLLPPPPHIMFHVAGTAPHRGQAQLPAYGSPINQVQMNAFDILRMVYAAVHYSSSTYLIHQL